MIADYLLTSQIFAFLLIFCRIGAGIMQMPGVGEAYVSMRIRLLFALGVTAVLTPLLAPQMPRVPTQVPPLIMLMVAEILVGAFLGALTRMLISAAHIAGTVMAQQSGLAAAMMLDVTQTGQSTVLTNLMTISAVTMMFMLNLDHVMLRAITDSYALFPVGVFPPINDFAEYAMRLVSGTFALSIQLSGPLIVMGLILYLAAGVMSRLMPSMQIFFILLPPQMFLSFFIMMVCMGPIMLWYMNYIDTTMMSFLQVP